jgi:hypothetical protein
MPPIMTGRPTRWPAQGVSIRDLIAGSTSAFFTTVRGRIQLCATLPPRIVDTLEARGARDHLAMAAVASLHPTLRLAGQSRTDHATPLRCRSGLIRDRLASDWIAGILRALRRIGQGPAGSRLAISHRPVKPSWFPAALMKRVA